jgi:nucleoside-diphosphate-sugar epimerase
MRSTASIRNFLHQEQAERNVDYIIHLAAYGNKYDQQNEFQMIQANILKTWHLLEGTKDIPYKAFINTGSSSEYGTKATRMFESDSLDTNTFYGATKAAATMLCRAFAKKYNKPIATVRPFSVYGIGDDPKKFIPTVISRIKNNEELTLSKGVHDWVHINDVVEAILLITQKIEEVKGQEINIGTGIQTSNLEVVTLLRDILSKPGKINYVEPLRDYDTDVLWVCDNNKLKSLGWKPAHDLEEYLARLALTNK